MMPRDVAVVSIFDNCKNRIRNHEDYFSIAMETTAPVAKPGQRLEILDA